MSTRGVPEQTTAASQLSSPSPTVFWLPGTAMLAVGLSMVTDGGHLGLGSVLCALGSALVLVGAVAQGVAWGMGMHQDRHP